jgi:hypothetical protein
MVEQSNCSVTHPQIDGGACPHCGLLVAMDQSSSQDGTVSPGVRWNIARMLDDLDRDDEATRLTTIFNLSDHLPPLAQALPVASRAFHDRARRVRNRALTAAVRLSGSTDEHVLVETCESTLREDPADVAALHVLLHFYTSERARSESYRKSRHSLVLRLIEEMPDAPDSLWMPMKILAHKDAGAFEQAKALWLAKIDKHPDDPRILGNAAFFFQFVDEVMAGKLLRQCKELEPANPRWSRELGGLYSRQGAPQHPESYQDWGLMSLAELENAWNTVTDSDGRYYALLQIPAVALQAGETEKARHYAERLLLAASEQPHEIPQICGNREANMALGWYALYKNDLDDARNRLLSARAPTAAWFMLCYCSMDPLMKLVGWMLHRQQREAVLEYLRRDQQLVPEFGDRLAKWTREIEQGLTPDFQDRALVAENLEIAKRLAPKLTRG